MPATRVYKKEKIAGARIVLPPSSTISATKKLQTNKVVKTVHLRNARELPNKLLPRHSTPANSHASQNFSLTSFLLQPQPPCVQRSVLRCLELQLPTSTRSIPLQLPANSSLAKNNAISTPYIAKLRDFRFSFIFHNISYAPNTTAKSLIPYISFESLPAREIHANKPFFLRFQILPPKSKNPHLLGKTPKNKIFSEKPPPPLRNNGGKQGLFKTSQKTTSPKTRPRPALL